MRKSQTPKSSRRAPRAPKRADESYRFRELGQLSISIRLGQYRVQMLGMGYIEPKWWRNYLHTHSAFEICYAFAGQGTFTSGGVIHKVRKGDLFIARPADAHEIISSRSHPLGIFFWMHTLIPDHTIQERTGVNALLQTFARGKAVVARAPGSMRVTLELLVDAAVRSEAGIVHEVEGLTMKLVLDTARAGADRRVPREIALPRNRSGAEAIVQIAERYVMDNLSRPIGMPDIAAQAQVSARHLGRLFLARRKITVMQHVTAVRLDAAAQLLLDPERTIKQVAFECGFRDVRYFTTLFRRRLASTPARFRAAGGTRFHARA